MDLNQRVDNLFSNEINDELEYYFISLFSENKKTYINVYSSWAGWVNIEKKIEKRVPREINPHKVFEEYCKIGEQPVIVNTNDEFIAFYSFGGHALINKIVYNTTFKNAESSCVSLGGFGFKSVSLEEQEKPRKISRKERMKIFKRDNYQCQICGRSTYDYDDIELQLHHIKPYSQGGLSFEYNIITLCKSCHDGLDPHYDIHLYNFLLKKTLRKNYYEKIVDYQKEYIEYLKNHEKI